MNKISLQFISVFFCPMSHERETNTEKENSEKKQKLFLIVKKKTNTHTRRHCDYKNGRFVCNCLESQ